MMVEKPEEQREHPNTPQTGPNDIESIESNDIESIEDVVGWARGTVDALQRFYAQRAARTSEAGADTQRGQSLDEFKKLVAHFGSTYLLLRQRDPEQADAGLQHIIDTLRSKDTPFGLEALQNYQYDPGAVFYKDLLEKVERMLWGEEDEGDREFVAQARVARAGWLRRHGDTQEAIEYALMLQYILTDDAGKRSSVEYELAKAYEKNGDMEQASKWMEKSGQSAAEAGDERGERIARAECLHRRVESDPVGCEDAIIALRKEFENQARGGKSDDEREDGRRWVLNTTCWLAHAASKLENAENLEKYIAEIDVEEGLEKRWLPPAELTELRVGLERLKRA